MISKQDIQGFEAAAAEVGVRLALWTGMFPFDHLVVIDPEADIAEPVTFVPVFPGEEFDSLDVTEQVVMMPSHVRPFDPATYQKGGTVILDEQQVPVAQAWPRLLAAAAQVLKARTH